MVGGDLSCIKLGAVLNMAACSREADFFGEELLNHSYTNFSGIAIILLKNACLNISLNTPVENMEIKD